MNCCRLFPLLVVALLAATSLSAEQAQDGTQPRKQDSTGKEKVELKLVKPPITPYPEEALRKNIVGKVVLSIVVNAQGRVSDAKALSGPPELVQAAIDSAKLWEFEPPTHAPVVTTAEVHYGHPKECPGPVSDSGEVSGSGGVRNDKGLVLSADDDSNWHLPPYFDEDRKAGVAGEMILALTVNSKGEVTNVRVVKSLSPHLDKAAVDAARTWKYKVIAGEPESLPDDFQLHIFYRATCRPQF
jgi:TonB family protein